MKNYNESRRVSILMATINSAQAEIDAIKNRITDYNIVILKREILNLIDGVGIGYHAGNYYAPDRYYSSIPGIKNIRIEAPDRWDNRYRVLVKLYTPVGNNLPSTVIVRGVEYHVLTCKSRNYCEEVDY